MTVFYVYSPDGGPQPPEALEFAANLDIPRYQLIQRALSGVGEGAFVSDLADADEPNAKAWHRVSREDEWAPSTSAACVWVWWRYTSEPIPDVANDQADEVWKLGPDNTVLRERFTGDDVRHRRGRRARPTTRPFDT